MLLNDFFKINTLEKEENTINTEITIDKNHAIFEGHFPGQPVVPGVCLTQMVKEVVEQELGKKYRMTKAGNIKFMAVVDPSKTPDLNLKITFKEKEENSLSVACESSFGETVAFKFKGVFELEK